MGRILMVESKKYRRDPIAVREVLLGDHSLNAVLLQPVGPGQETADLNLAVLSQNSVLHRANAMLYPSDDPATMDPAHA